LGNAWYFVTISSIIKADALRKAIINLDESPSGGRTIVEQRFLARNIYKMSVVWIDYNSSIILSTAILVIDFIFSSYWGEILPGSFLNFCLCFSGLFMSE
jgi:hypothetical protein